MDCKKGGSLVPIKRIEIHPYFVPGKPNFDIALLRMALPVDYSDVLRPIGVSNIRGKVLGAKFMTTYWPRIVVSVCLNFIFHVNNKSDFILIV